MRQITIYIFGGGVNIQGTNDCFRCDISMQKFLLVVEFVITHSVFLFSESLCNASSVKKRRHYRGGFNYAGMATHARKLRSKQTEAESCLWRLLRNRQVCGFKFRRQHQFGDYIADFYCHEAQLVIECDGSIHDINENWQHDQTRDAYMVGHGLRVLRFTNDEVLNNTSAVLNRIAVYLIKCER
jgi:type I restriction enzyme R subunit